MKGFLVAGVALAALLAGPARAADRTITVAAYKAPPRPVYSWTGCYLGASGGWIGDQKRFDRNADGELTTTGGLVLAETTTRTDTNTSSGLAGATLGCNYQLNSWGVIGVEGDWSWTGIDTSRTESFPRITGLAPRIETFGSEMNSLATIRGRIGALAAPDLLLYLTGGAAFAQDKASFGLINQFGSIFLGADTRILSGGVVGAGAERAVGNWSVKAEYLYVSLAGHTFNAPVVSQGGTPPTTFAGGNWITAVGRHSDNIFRVGVNYRFGDAPVASTGVGTAAFASKLPVKAPRYKAPTVVAYNWSGWHLGINGGYGWNRRSGDTFCTAPGGVIGGTGCIILPSANLRPAGGIFGGQIGYDLQAAPVPIVYGLEADLQGSQINDLSVITSPGFAAVGGAITGGPVTSPGTFNISQNLEWFGTLRGRLGVAADRVLPYVTGGLIYGRENVTENLSLAGDFPVTAGKASTRAGWTAGAGVEAAITPSVTGRLEGLYYDMGSETLTAVNPGSGFAQSSIFTYRRALVRAAVNLRF